MVLHADGTVLYTPEANFYGTDSSTYMIANAAGQQDTATVALTVNAVNDAPTAKNDVFVTNDDKAVFTTTKSLLANDTDVEGHALSLLKINGGAVSSGSVITLDSGATLTVQPDGSLIFDPKGHHASLKKGETATETFTYTVADSVGGESAGATGRPSPSPAPTMRSCRKRS